MLTKRNLKIIPRNISGETLKAQVKELLLLLYLLFRRFENRLPCQVTQRFIIIAHQNPMHVIAQSVYSVTV